MNKALEIFLGILTAMGGFVEVGELTFAVDAGVKFGYGLIAVVVVGTIGIIVYCEMAGRVSAVIHQPVFSLIRERVGVNLGLVTLIAATLVNLLTCTAEIGGVALVWQLGFGGSYRALALIAFAFFVVVVWVTSFKWIERIFGLGGLLLAIAIAVAFAESPDWHEVARGFVPGRHLFGGSGDPMLYAYYGVALFSSVLLPYETYFYGAGAIEDGWQPDDIAVNRFIVIVGFVLGSVLSLALMSIGARFFAPQGAEPQLPGVAALSAASVFGTVAVLTMLAGMFFAFAGAAIETCLCNAYNIAHFFGWPWGKAKRPGETPRFTLTWLITFAIGALVIQTGVDPVAVVEYSIVFSVIILPLSYFPLLIVASDRRLMREHVNGALSRTLGWIFLVLVTMAALAAVPLLVLAHGGKG
jgi:Mn2+/Fe2+ NRAMP family transporter